jgi:NADH:ubiquinone oxidoreductase subunit F (NADH-binding)
MVKKDRIILYLDPPVFEGIHRSSMASGAANAFIFIGYNQMSDSFYPKQISESLL